MITLSIDPGLRGTGVALFDAMTLVHVAYPRNPDRKRKGPEAWYTMAREVVRSLIVRPDDIALEVPQVYSQARNRGKDPNDLIPLAGIDGLIVGMLQPENVVGFLPREWKGQVPKEIHNRRILSRLTPDEQAILDLSGVPPSLMHNVVDAVGIGLFAVGRR